MIYSYVRVSSKDQHEDRQIKELENQGIQPDQIFMDKQSGKDFDRPEYKKMLSQLKEGDIIYIHSIDRLGRNYDEIIANWQLITKDIKADIVVLDMPLLNTTVENSNLTGRFIADLVLQILSYVAETERNNIKKRQMEGIAIAKANGKFRKKEIDMDLFKSLEKDVDAGKVSVTTAAAELGVTRMTWYNLRKEFDPKETENN